ncbi:GDSL-type esterase/lipase family protein [Streptomyces sp. MMS21 TC-5]|uniref:GDSL-type esterase/lipase family protein n=1 Tax=Streptomyces sp. MMS21 TC-5 TaxID=2925833 RepID=UPI001F61F9E0|nr:GDSL-type esterase/lipase family protein [Streptomyces sp. MMS21 TC-5]MCI4080402.1 GDSL-type esterase/lipase family protein [Streptomyces sp. MMS21 TC-5]
MSAPVHDEGRPGPWQEVGRGGVPGARRRAGQDTWQDPQPFLRGVAWLDKGRPVRADPADTMRLPWDTGERATLPIGVRLEFTTETARAVEIRYRATVPGPTDALRDLAHGFALWDRHGVVSEVFTEPAAEAVVRIALGSGDGPFPGPFTIHPPENQSPLVLGLRGIGGALSPAPPAPRWVVHGDSITEGWWSTRPAHGWPAVAGRALGWDAVNLGYAGAARGELATAEQLAGLPADVLTLAFGTNCWSRVPFSAPLLYETTRAFLELVRQGHPRTPLLLVSPVLRPDAERTPNKLGATLGALRDAMERATRDRMAAGDDRLAVLPGRDLLGPEHLADGLHPNDSGHQVLGLAVATALRRAGFGGG